MICRRVRCETRAAVQRKEPMNSVEKIAQEKLVLRKLAKESPS